jgi:hypothetical protein
MFYYNVNGEEFYQAPLFMQKIFEECYFIMEMDKNTCIMKKEDKLYKLNFETFLKTRSNNLNDFIDYLKKRYEDIK